MGVRDRIAKAVMGIKAYHSSPHDFDKFDLSKIGTGEGAQVYGHGLYFAENPAVSGQGGQYWGQFLNKFGGGERDAATTLRSADFDRAKAAALIQRDIEQARQFLKEGFSSMPAGDARVAKALAAKEQALQLLESGKPVGPRTYEVNIKADPAHMLDWDKPLSAQPHATKTIMDLLPAAERRRIERWEKPKWSDGDPKASYFDTVKGGTEYQGLAGILGKSDKASAALRDAGIPGIKYLDEGSRISSPSQIDLIRQNIAQREALLAKNPGNPTDTKWLAEYQDMLRRAENPTSNFVVFDPGIIDIMKKYGVVGAPAGALGMGALADESRYEVAQ